MIDLFKKLKEKLALRLPRAVKIIYAVSLACLPIYIAFLVSESFSDFFNRKSTKIIDFGASIPLFGGKTDFYLLSIRLLQNGTFLTFSLTNPSFMPKNSCFKYFSRV